MACDHKFVDSERCLKCGWSPHSNRGKRMSPTARTNMSRAQKLRHARLRRERSKSE